MSPYIPSNRRLELRKGYEPETPGELNYAITKLCASYYRRAGGRYAQINDVLGALEGAKLEFYRRVAAPYEDGKLLEHGDVYR